MGAWTVIRATQVINRLHWALSWSNVSVLQELSKVPAPISPLSVADYLHGSNTLGSCPTSQAHVQHLYKYGAERHDTVLKQTRRNTEEDKFLKVYRPYLFCLCKKSVHSKSPLFPFCKLGRGKILYWSLKDGFSCKIILTSAVQFAKNRLDSSE